MAKKQISQRDVNRLIKQLKRDPIRTSIIILITLIGSFFGGKSIIEQSDKGSSRDVQTFAKAKTELIKIYQENPAQKEFYCGCDFKFNDRKSALDLASCGYKIRKDEVRANRIEWEHVMPAHNFGKQLRCWKEGGRKNCGGIAQFDIMEGDMHNLQPAVGEVNADRSNFRFSEFTKKFNQYGKCEFATDFKKRQVQPRKEVKGMIARTYLYMEQRYGIVLASQEKNLMQEWNRAYPAKQWECRRNQIIAKKQGNDNPFITEQCVSR